MGVGEPFLNLDLVFQMFDLNKKKEGFIFSYALASMMLSSSGFQKIYKKVKKDKMPLKIHFSLHSPMDRVRHLIIPSSKETISRCLGRLKKYQAFIKTQKEIVDNLSKFHKTRDAVEIHYTIIKDVNDTENDLNKLIGIGQKDRIALKILKFNPTESLKRSDREKYWLKRLKKEYGAPVVFYMPPGPNIGSSCGQFTKHYYLGSHSQKQLKEFHQWKLKYEVK
jgi:adenine C2-methylase RlmN of 23S rRNA A2503 and tRNA A37